MKQRGSRAHTNVSRVAEEAACSSLRLKESAIPPAREHHGTAKGHDNMGKREVSGAT